MTAAFSLFNRIGLDTLFGSDDGDGGISVWLFALLAFISGIASLLGGKLFRRKSSRKEGEVSIYYRGKSIVLKAMVDSGNLLKEPISGKNCIVVDMESVKDLFPNGIIKSNGQISEDIVKRIRVIPTASVNGEGMLYAFRADNVKVNLGRGWCDADVYIALCKLRNHADGVKALIPSELAFCTI